MAGKTEKQAENQRERERERGMGGGQGPFKREYSECVQEVSLVAIAEDVSCQDPKGRPAY